MHRVGAALFVENIRNLRIELEIKSLIELKVFNKVF